MKKLPTLTAVALMAAVSSAHAQTLLANFQASSYTGGSTFTDTEGVSATAVGTPTAGAGDINTTTGAFTFNTGSVTGLDGLTNYTMAVGFTSDVTGATSGSYANGDFYGGYGLFGADIPGAGQGDSGLTVTPDGNGQIVAGAGVGGGNDQAVYDTQTGSATGTFTSGASTGAVLVVNGTTGTISLYVNGALTTQPGSVSGLTINPFGDNNGTVGSFTYGLGEIFNGVLPGNGSSTAFNPGDITQFQIFSGADTAAQAMALSTSIALPSASAVVPEPSTWALLLGGLGALVALRTRSKAA